MLFASKAIYFKKAAAIAGFVLAASFLPMFTQSANAETWYECAAGRNECLRDASEAFRFCVGAIDSGCFTSPEPDRISCLLTKAIIKPAPDPSICVKTVNPTTGNMESKNTPVTWATRLVLTSIVGIVNFINSYLVYAVAWAGGMMDATINIAMAPLQGVGAIETGWRISRDVANVFFIFFLLTIAIATILRIEKYGAKALLAKLIIAAILINFSLVIAQVVVDASNVLGITFVSKIHPVSDKIAAVLEISKMRSQGTGAPPKTTVPFSVAPGTLSAVANQNTGFAKGGGIVPLNPSAANPLDPLVNEMFYVTMIFIFQLLVMFVFLALAILFIIRTVALMLIFILAPLGFLFSVLPATQSYANEWWKNLFSWSFFFPASTFMLYIAISFGYELRNINFQGNQASNQGLAFATITMICLLMGSLIVARKMGIYGASAVMGYGNKLRGRARGYLGKGLRYATVGAVGAGAGYAATKFSPAAGRMAERYGTNPFMRTLVKPLARLQQVGAQQASPKEKRWEEIVGRGDSSFKAAYAATVTPSERAAARKVALKKDKGHLLSAEDLQKEHARATVDNDRKALQSIYKVNPKLAALGEPDPVKQQIAVNSAVKALSTKDIEEKLDAKALKDDMVQNALLIHAGEKEMEAGLNEFGVDFASAIAEAYARLENTIGATAAFDQTLNDNKTVFRTAITNPSFATTSAGTSMRAAAIAGKTRRDNEEAQKDEDALRDQVSRQRAGAVPTAAEIDRVRAKAKKVEFK